MMTQKINRALCLLSGFLLITLSMGMGRAQSGSQGTIAVTVVDATGGVVPGAMHPNPSPRGPRTHELHYLVSNPGNGPNVGIGRTEVHPDAKGAPFSASRSARIRYPRNGSRRNCQGRYAAGLRMRHGLPPRNARIRSGMSWSLVQSPPPIAFPARALPKATP